MKSFALLSLTVLLAAAAFAQGCATSASSRRALVCPDCKTVEVTEENSSWGYDSPSPASSTRMEHRCPGCQGALNSLFKEGKLRHQCSICPQDAFTCPVEPPLVTTALWEL